MVNPISSIPTAILPQAAQPVINPTDGTMTPLFHRLLLSIYQRTGGASGASSTDSLDVANAALTAATIAQEQSAITQAGLDSLKVQVANLASAVEALSVTANDALNNANTAQANALLRPNNLSDVTSVSVARSNLQLTTVPAVFQFDSLPAGLLRGVPVVQSLKVQPNFAGTVLFWVVPPASDAVFQVSTKLHGPLGTITVASGGTGVQFSLQPAVSLSIGDTLIVRCPSPPDSALAQVAINFPLVLI